MQKLQSQGVHHITLVGADRQTSIDFWEGVLGMPFVFEQPNLDKASESHLYFDPGDPSTLDDAYRQFLKQRGTVAIDVAGLDEKYSWDRLAETFLRLAA